jgi:tRNA (guanine37-N1)-methyltransferase
MRIDFLTIFPELIESFLRCSLIGKARETGLIFSKAWNIRDFADGSQRRIDDTPYGGGAGMVMMAEPIMQSIEAVRRIEPQSTVVCLSPTGDVFNQAVALELSQLSSVTFLCGRYEGIDERVLKLGVNRKISIGDYILCGGEVASMVIAEAMVRLLPGVLGNDQSIHTESFQKSEEGSLFLEAPQYTKPSMWRGHSVPEVLLTGDHGKIAAWRKEKSLELTRTVRPDLLQPEDSF